MFSNTALKQAREEKEISQEELMIQLANAGHKVSRPTLSNWETGDSVPNANDLAKLAEVLRKPVKYFFVS